MSYMQQVEKLRPQYQVFHWQTPQRTNISNNEVQEFHRPREKLISTICKLKSTEKQNKDNGSLLVPKI